ncbi:MAG TPA: hypothetical protein V6D50_27675, partial [Chroococcales cyanobacterium]
WPPKRLESGFEITKVGRRLIKGWHRVDLSVDRTELAISNILSAKKTTLCGMFVVRSLVLLEWALKR